MRGAGGVELREAILRIFSKGRKSAAEPGIIFRGMVYKLETGGCNVGRALVLFVLKIILIILTMLN